MLRTAIIIAFLSLNLTSQAEISLGDPAPNTTFPLTNGENAQLSDYLGQWVVLYFYPKSDTPGCTKQACSLRDDYSQLDELNAIVLGASVDTVDDQQKFRSKYELPFELIADKDKSLAGDFDVLMLGKMMAKRKTFIINPEGKIAHIFEKAQTTTHFEEVSQVLKKLQSP